MDTAKKTKLFYFWYFALGFLGVIGALYLSIYFEQIGKVYMAIDSFLLNIASRFFQVPQWFTIITYYVIYSIFALPLYLTTFLFSAPRKQYKENSRFILFSLLSYSLGIFVSSAAVFMIILQALRG